MTKGLGPGGDWGWYRPRDFKQTWPRFRSRSRMAAELGALDQDFRGPRAQPWPRVLLDASGTRVLPRRGDLARIRPLPGGQWELRGSLSAYHYTGMREFFTCALAATGVFLIACKVFGKSSENVITVIAGLAVTLVAFFPINRPRGILVTETALQRGFPLHDLISSLQVSKEQKKDPAQIKPA